MTRSLASHAGTVATALLVLAALALGWGLWRYYTDAPWTRDGLVHADVVVTAPDVSGLVIEVAVRENQKVRRGDVLFRIDPARFALAVQQAEAEVASRKAARDEAASILSRFERVGDIAVTEEAVTNQRFASAMANAAYEAALVAVNVARLNLERATVRASVNGIVTNFDVQPGDYVSTGKGVFALVDSDSFAVDGFFEETKLSRIKVGDPARVTLMGGATLTGTVQGIAAAISGNIPTDGRLLSNVNPVFEWVRLARRIPVRITLDAVPADAQLVAGRSATVEILPRP